MLPTIPKRGRAPKPFDAGPSIPTPGRPDRETGEAGGRALSVELASPLGATGVFASKSSHGRGHLLHLGTFSSIGFGGAVTTQDHPAPTSAGEAVRVGRDGGQPQCSLRPTVMDKLATGPTAAGVLPLPNEATSLQAADLVTGTPMISSVPTSNQSTPVADTRSVQLLQQLQQLLQSGVPTAMLQQWVSGQLLQATAPAAPTRPAAAVVVVSPPSAGRLSPTALSAAALGQPLSPGVPSGSRPPRRPASAVSFSLFTNQLSHTQQQRQQLSPQHGTPLDSANVAVQPSSAAPTVGSLCTANSGSVPSALTSAVDGGEVTLAPAMCSATSVAAVVLSEPEIGAPLSGASLPCSAGSAMLPPLESVPSSADDPLASGAGNDVDLAAAHHRGAGGSLLKASHPHLQHSQWRSFRNQSSSGVRSSSATSLGGKRPATVSGTGANISAPTIILHSKSPSPAGTPRHCRIASALHSATKAAIHATTSQLVAQNQQKNISLLLGERFSRHPENFVRRVTTRLPVVDSGSPGTPALSEATSGAALSARRSHPGSDSNTDDDICSLSTATTALERLNGSAGLLVAPQTRSPSVASVPLRVAERSVMAAVEFPSRCLPLISVATEASGGSPTSKFFTSCSPRSITSPALLTAATEHPGNGSSEGSFLQDHHSVSDDRGALSIAPCDGNDVATSAQALFSASVESAPAHQRSNNIPPEKPTDGEAGGPLKLSLHQRRLSSSLSGLMSGRTPTVAIEAAAEAASGDAAERVAAAEVPDVVFLIEIDTEATSASCTPAREATPHNTSSLFSGGDSGHLAHSWGGTATHAGERPQHPHRGSISTLPAVSASATSLAWVQPSPNSSSPAAALATSLSQFAPSPSAAARCTHQASVTPWQTTSFVSTTSSHLGCGGATGGHGPSVAFNVTHRDSLSLHDEIPSLGSGPTAGVSSLGEGMNGNRRGRSSVLHLSRSSMNGGVDPMEGVMASFILDDINGATRRSGPRFLRSFCRHTPVRAMESVAHAALEGLGVPFIEGIDHASVPTNVLAVMNAYGFTDRRAFYVAICLNVFLRYEFVQRFGWNVQKLKKFLEVAATYFRDGNPFHNPVHAVDVVMAAHQWLSEGSTGAALSDDEAMTFLLTAMVQQIAHTGADNRLLGQLKHPYAMLCSYASPQQGATVALVMALLSRPELHFFPDPCLATAHTTGTGGVADPAVVQEWTNSRELQMYDMLADLIMATDERNHATLRHNIMRMGEENARLHGCMCASTHADRSYSILSRSLFRSTSQADVTTQLQYPSPQGNFCLNCCAYITDAHVPDLLKAVLHFIDFAYLFRPYQVYLCGSIAYMAELYRQSEREYALLQRLQEQQLLRALTRRASGESLGETVPQQPSGAQSPGAPFSAPTTDAYTPAVTFATALLAEQQPWRQGVAQASTMTSLQRSSDEVTVAADTPPPSCRATVVTLPSEMTASHHAVSPSPLTLQVTRAPQDEGAAASHTLDRATRAQPLKGLGRDIVLISMEDLCLPFLEQLAPYMPEAWVAASYQNHQRLMKSLPTPEKFDEVVNRFLDFGVATEAELLEEDTEKEGEIEDEEADSLAAKCPFTLPWRLLRPVRPIAAEWTADKDGVMRRVVREIMRGPTQLLKESDDI
nr:unnamed protein product [Leishmania braziliensis]